MRMTIPESEAYRILEECEELKAPVNVEKIAGRLGIEIRPGNLGEGVSGVLILEGGKAVIGCHEGDSSLRKRFTIAHEIGHFILHRTEAPLFVDARYIAAYRNERSSTGQDLRERQANVFAASLLMPRALVIQAIAKHQFDLADEGDAAAIKELADQFEVSTQAMTIRLSSLGVF